MARSYNDPVKEESRARLRSFIQRHLSFRRPNDIRVLCLPGAEHEGEEALEVKQVYDPLGIPRKNITGLEMDPERAQRLRNADLGLRVIEASDLEFFRAASPTIDKFDVISLDYTGWQGRAAAESLSLIAGKHLLAGNGVLCTNYSAKRESDTFKRELLLRLGAFGEYVAPWEPDPAAVPDQRNIDDVWDYFQTARAADQHDRVMRYTAMAAKDELEDADLDHLREAISCTIIEMLTKGSFARVYHDPEPWKHIPKLFKDLKGYNTTRKLLSDDRRRDANTEEALLTKKAKMRAQRMSEKEWQDFIAAPEHMGGRYMDVFLHAIGHHIGAQIGIGTHAATILALAMCDREMLPYGIRTVERYSYVSNKNYLMLMDIYGTFQSPDTYNLLDNLILFHPGSLQARANPRALPEKQLRRVSDKLYEYVTSVHRIPPLPEREFLGSSWKRPERIGKKDAIDFLKLGCTPTEIVECYRGFTERQLRAYKAQITRGRY